MAIAAGEAGLGVALLTLLIRAHGNDYIIVGLV